MSNINLAPFYVGQKVEYITGHNMPKCSIHIVLDIWRENCGCWIIDVGASNKHGKIFNSKFVYCNKCGGRFPNSTHKAGTYATSFRAIEEAKPPLMTFTQIKEKEKEEILILN